MAHININSVRHKHEPLYESLTKGLLDILFVQESKIDQTFPEAQFKVPGFKLYRNDCTSNMGGIIAHVRDDIVQRRMVDMENLHCNSGRIETVIIEITVNCEKWLLCSMYKQPVVKNVDFTSVFEDFITRCYSQYSNIIVMGDLNINMNVGNHCISDVFDIHGIKNIVTSPTCFKGSNPTLIDVVLSNVPKRLQGTFVFDTSLSDFHHMVCFATKIHIPKKSPRIITYRSYKRFDEVKYLRDLHEAPFQVAEIFDSVDDVYWFQQCLMKQIMDENAPIKTKKVKHVQLPFMNGKLRKEINYKNMLKRKYEKWPTHVNWTLYKKHRNYVVKLRKESVRNYMKNKCIPGQHSRDFWKVVNPLISDKQKGNCDNLTLVDNDVVLSDSNIVCSTLNNYFVGVAKHIGHEDPIHESQDADIDEIVNMYRNHDSISFIRSNTQSGTFKFSAVSQNEVLKKLKAVNPRKATGFDVIPPKLIKLGAVALCGPLSFTINACIETSTFPSELKCAEVSPVFKKGDSSTKENYRPISILPCISKIVESVMIDQLSTFFETRLSPYMSGFRKGHNCENVLLRFIEKCKSSLDESKVYGALLTDLSKAFDCLPHKLLIAKLSAYGVDKQACKFISNYFMNRKQRVKIGNTRSDWNAVTKGAAQGSIFGPFTFNVHLNDLLNVVSQSCDVFNYADDNTIGCNGNNAIDVCTKLQSIANNMIMWFQENDLKANPDKFQMIIFDKKHQDHTVVIDNITIKNKQSVKLLGLDIDRKLTFHDHITKLCRKAGNKVNVLARLSSNLDINSKMVLFYSFILSHFEYCAPIMHFCGTGDTRKIEKIQKRALRHIYKDFSSNYTTLMVMSGRSLMYMYRLRSILTEVYKIVRKECPIYLHDLFTIKNSVYDTRNVFPIALPLYKSIRYGKSTLYYQGAYLWNNMPSEIKTSQSLQVFKKSISEWNLMCNCQNCVLCSMNEV